jgi:uncharacterized C2H2 Zn-finger protein
MAGSKFTCSRCLRDQHDYCTAPETCGCALAGHQATRLAATPTAPAPASTPVAKEVQADGDGTLRCDRCPRTFTRKNGLSRHLRESHGVPPADPTGAARKARSRARSATPAKAASALPPPDPGIVPQRAPGVLLEQLVSAPGEWSEVGRIELQTRRTDSGTLGVFARLFEAADG